MAKAYKLTAKRRAALRKAQAASARKRKGKGRSGSRFSSRTRRNLKRGVVGTVAAGALAGAVVARHKYSGSGFVSATTHTPAGLPSHHYKTGVKVQRQGGGRYAVSLVTKAPGAGNTKTSVYVHKPVVLGSVLKGRKGMSVTSGPSSARAGNPRYALPRPSKKRKPLKKVVRQKNIFQMSESNKYSGGSSSKHFGFGAG